MARRSSTARGMGLLPAAGRSGTNARSGLGAAPARGSRGSEGGRCRRNPARDPNPEGASPACAHRDRRRRPCRPVPGARAQAGARRRRRGHGVRSGAGARSGRRQARLRASRRRRGGMLEALGVWEAVAAGRSRSSTWSSPTAASPTRCGRCSSPSTARSRRASPSPTWSRAGALHRRARRSALPRGRRRACDADRRSPASSRCGPRSAVAARRRRAAARRPSWSRPTGRARACASRPASAGIAWPYPPVRHRRHGRARARPRRAARTSISCPPGPSRSCRSNPGGAARPPLLDRLDRAQRRRAGARRLDRRGASGRARAALRPAARRDRARDGPRAPIRSPSAIARTLRAPSASRSSAMRRTSSTRSPARASISAFTMRRRWPRAIVDAVRLGLDPGGAGRARRYERARRFDTIAMGIVTDGLNRLFSNDAAAGAPRPRPRPRPRRPHAGAEALLHPRGGGSAPATRRG